MKKHFIILGTLLFVLLLNKVTFIIDADTGKLIPNSTIIYKYSNFSTGCGSPKESTTLSGINMAPLKPFICAMKISAPGYHINGSNSTWYVLKRVKLYPQVNKDEFIKNQHRFLENEGLDVLAYINSSVNNDGNIKKPETNDFIFTKIINKYSTNSTAHIKFVDKGGIQQISNTVPSNKSGEYYFDMENLRVAPDDGYQTELDIVPGKSYVARLRNGENYMKLITFIGQDYKTNENYVCLSMFISKYSGKSLDFINTSPSGVLCSNNKNISTYDNNNNYTKFKEAFSTSFKIKMYNSSYNQITLENGYYISLKSSLPLDVAHSLRKNNMITATIPTYEEFIIKRENNAGMYMGVPINLNINNFNITGYSNIPIDILSWDYKEPFSTIKESCDFQMKGKSYEGPHPEFSSKQYMDEFYYNCINNSYDSSEKY